MKFRLLFLVILLSLALVACSLAEDITPPPGYGSLTSLPPTSPITQTSVPTSTETLIPTIQPVSGSTETSPTTSDNITPAILGTTAPAISISPTAQPIFVVITGTVTGLFGAVLPADTSATLLVYNTTTSQVIQSLATPILPDGNYEFSNIPADKTTVYFVTVDYKGVTYESDPAQFDGSVSQFSMPVSVYDSTEDLSALSITQAHMQFDFSTDGEVQVGLVYVIGNPGTRSVVFPSAGNDVPFIQVPSSSGNVQYQLDQSSSPLMLAANGYAFLPGADKEYVIITSFTLPYTGSLNYSQPFNPPVSSATVIVPEGVKVKSNQLTDGGTQASTGSTTTTFHLYQAGSLASGSTLTMTISGKPGDKAGFNPDQRTLLLIGVVFLGLILVGLGIFLFVRDRRLQKLAEFEGVEKHNDDALGEDRENIMDAIIALDDQFKAGDISKEAYEKRRDELKARLINLAQ
jgi:hypothetical protein